MVLLTVKLVQVILAGSLDDFVVNICDVHHEKHFVSEIIRHDSSKDIKGEVGPGVAHVRSIIDRGATVVPGNLS